MGKDLNRHFSKEKIKIAKEDMKKKNNTAQLHQ